MFEKGAHFIVLLLLYLKTDVVLKAAIITGNILFPSVYR